MPIQEITNTEEIARRQQEFDNFVNLLNKEIARLQRFCAINCGSESEESSFAQASIYITRSMLLTAFMVKGMTAGSVNSENVVQQ